MGNKGKKQKGKKLIIVMEIELKHHTFSLLELIVLFFIVHVWDDSLDDVIVDHYNCGIEWNEDNYEEWMNMVLK